MLKKETSPDRGYILTGRSGDKILLLKTDSQGSEQWRHVYDSNGAGFSVKQTSDNGYVLTGVKDNQIYLLKTDSQGNL